MATVTCLVAVAIFALQGAAPFTVNDTSLGKAIMLYLAAGVSGGGLVGALLPLATWRWGASILGVLGAATLYVPIALSQPHPDILAGLIPSVVVGSIVGFGAWTPLGDPSESSKSAHVDPRGRESV
jgi:hypothetical protein